MRPAAFPLFSWLLLLSSCGYVGPIVPPSPEIPAAVKDLVAVERGNKIEVFFRTPPRTTDNLAIKKFSAIDLRIGPDVVPFDFAAWANGATAFPLPPPPPGDALDPKPLPITGSLPIEGLLGKHVTVAVRTAVKAGDHYSSWSNRIVLDIVEPVKTPTDLKIAASASGVVLDWDAVDAADQYRILRQAAGEPLTEVGRTDKPHFVDETSQFDTPYTYAVVALHGGAESLPAKLEPFTSIDKFAPSIPTGVTALAGPESIEVSWQRSPEADTAGYLIYRSVDGGPFEKLPDMSNLSAFSDRKVEHGRTYRYQITAIDQKKNESERSAIVEVPF